MQRGAAAAWTAETLWMKSGTGKLIETIPLSAVKPSDTTVSSEAGFEVLCSYNWHKNGNAIFVPGGPPKWTPPALPVTLPQDYGLQFKDLNAVRFPNLQFAPAFQALSIMKPNTRLDKTHIIVNRGGLHQLLYFVRGRRQNPFRMICIW
jgi:hypothetical protein